MQEYTIKSGLRRDWAKVKKIFFKIKIQVEAAQPLQTHQAVKGVFTRHSRKEMDNEKNEAQDWPRWPYYFLKFRWHQMLTYKIRVNFKQATSSYFTLT